ncbi:Ribosomal protein L11 methyltransferase [Hyella patelloides LEGE 07179]|uniref:Ribosomal protein L11 methyltransferase n=1 Tax=Hyella patelloides LEGE 07179 TaxID=945734 RepID=A0A563W3I8_9CYAN|nr:50S ribosomal protein L11 methyltransferase [Hyella patelloides]VEP18246.1 Ribosomal protein L11 methyltransferase [Hyella patelloides LEGE 07179]
MSNCWWEIIVVCDPILEESVFWRLDSFGCSGTSTQAEDTSYVVKAYIPDIKIKPLDLSALTLWLKEDAISVEATAPEVSWQLISEEDWASGWKQYWQPQKIGDRFLIYPAWLDIPQNPERLLLRLDPGAAFGTGTHPTTQLCLESLEMRFYEEAETLAIADIGCGSGILSIGAMLLGAKEVAAVDTDSLAIKTCRSNCQLNDIEQKRLIVREGSISELTKLETTYDGILCNILADIIVQLFPHFNTITHDKSWAILSGILLEQANQIADLVESNGWTVAALWKRQEWCCFNIRRSEY